MVNSARQGECDGQSVKDHNPTKSTHEKKEVVEKIKEGKERGRELRDIEYRVMKRERERERERETGKERDRGRGRERRAETIK